MPPITAQTEKNEVVEGINPTSQGADAASETGQTEKISSRDHTDVAHDLYQESLAMDPAARDLLARRVVRKLDFCVLPMMCFVYFLSFLDKSTLNYANAYGLQKDLHLEGRDYSWVASIANFGYLAGAYPMTIGLQKLPIGRFIGSMVVVWGILLSFTALAKDFTGIMVLRFLLGFAEAGIGPAWMLLTTMFWTKDEAPLRMAFWLGCNGLSQIIGAGISWGLGHTHGGLSPWQLIFLVTGLASLVVGIVCFFLMPSSPSQCVFFSHEETLTAVWRVRGNQTGIKHPKIMWYQVMEGIRDPKIYLIAMCSICLGLINGAVANFLTTLLKSFGYGDLKSVLYQMPGGAFQFTFTVLGGLFASHVPDTLTLTVILAYLPGLAGIIGILKTPLKYQIRLAACAWLLPITGLAIITTWTLVASNTAGHTKRTVANGIVFVFYAAGNIIGPFLFLPEEKPRYPTAIKALCGIYAAGIAFTAALGLYMWNENRKRKVLGVPEQEGNEAGFADYTDIENKGFVYRL